MKRKFKLLFLAALSSLTLTGCDLSGIISIKPADSSGEDIQPVVVDPTVLDEYYKGYDLSKTGGKLFLELQKLSFEKHKEWVPYGQVTSYYTKSPKWNSVEAISDGSTKNQSFYTERQTSGYSGTREHVWPCANSAQLWVHSSTKPTSFTPHYVDYTYYVGGGSDLYHVRACGSMINTARGNGKYVSFSDPEQATYASNTVRVTESGGKLGLTLYGAELTTTGSYQYADKVEPDDGMKGDIARIVLYVYMHYTERGQTPSGSVTKSGYTYNYSDMTGSLALTQIMGYDNEDRCLEVLKEWNKIDAPSDVEKLRNETVQKIQGNRNPFVDYPELVDQL